MLPVHKVVAKNTLIQIFGKLITASSTLLVTMLVARRFGPQGFGMFTIMTTFPTLFWIMVDFGFNQIAVREIVRDRKQAQRYFSNLLLLRFGLAVIFASLALIILRSLPYSPLIKLGTAINLLSIFVMSVFLSVQMLFQAQLAYELQAISQIAGSASSLILVLLFIYLGKGILPVALSSLWGYTVMAAVATLMVRRFIRFRQIRLDAQVARSLFFSTLPVGLALIFNVFDFKVDSLMLSFLPLPLGQENNAAVGYYGSAFKVFEVILSLPFFFVSSLYPILVKKFERSFSEGWHLFRKSAVVLSSLSIVVLFGGLILAPWIIKIVAGMRFASSVPALKILLLGLPFFFLTSLLGHCVMALGRQKTLPGIYGAATVLNILLNYIFIPRFSFSAAAAVTGITEVFVLLCLSWVLAASKRTAR